MIRVIISPFRWIIITNIFWRWISKRNIEKILDSCPKLNKYQEEEKEEEIDWTLESRKWGEMEDDFSSDFLEGLKDLSWYS